MRQVCQVGLLIAVLLVGCSKSKPEPKKATLPEGSKEKVGKVDGGGKPIDPKAKQREEDYQLAMSAARDALKEKNYKGAVNSFKAALGVKPGDRDATAGLASARKLLEAEVAKKPDPYTDWMKKGATALAEKKWAEAYKAFDEALQLKPGDIEAIKGKRKADEKIRLSKLDPKARKIEEDYLLATSAARDALLEKNYKGAVNAFKAALVVKPKDKVATAGLASAQKLLKAEEDRSRAAAMKDLTDRAAAAMKKKDYTQAVKLYTEALKLEPDNAAAKEGLRVARDEERREDKRRNAFDLEIRKGNKALADKKHDEAVKCFEAALKLYPTDTKAQALLAQAKRGGKPIDTKAKKIEEDYQLAMSAARDALKKKNYKGAVNSFKAALVVKPKDKDATEGLASAEKLLKAEEDRLREEEAKKKEAAYLAWMKKGQDAMKAKKFAEALKAFDEALKIKNGDKEAIKGKREADEKIRLSKLDTKGKKIEEDYQLAMSAARAALEKKNYKGAVNAFKAALVVKPGDKDATAGRDSAQKLLDAEVAKKPDPYTDWMKKGNDALKAMKWAEAYKAFDEALKIKPGDAEGIKGKRAADEGMKKATPPADPAMFDKLLAAAQTLEKQRKYADAVKAYQNALKVVVSDVKKNPQANMQMFKAWMGVGRCEHAAKRYMEAIKAYEEALKVVPNQPDAKAALARAKAGKP